MSSSNNNPTALPTNLPAHGLLNGKIKSILKNAWHLVTKLRPNRPLFHPLKLVWQSYTRLCILLALLIATAFGIPAWLGYQLAAWTAKKEYHDFCIERLSTLNDATLTDCRKAIEAGVPPPPLSNFRRSTPTVPSVAYGLAHLKRRTVVVWEKIQSNMQEPAISAGHQQTSDSLLADSYSFKAVVGLVSLMVAVFAIVVIAMSYGQMFRRRLIKIDVQGQESEVRTLSSYRSLQNRAYQSAVGLTMCLCSLLGTLAISIFTIRDVLKLHKEAENEYILYCQGIKGQDRDSNCSSAMASAQNPSLVLQNDARDYLMGFVATLGIVSTAVALFVTLSQPDYRRKLHACWDLPVAYIGRRSIGRYNAEQARFDGWRNFNGFFEPSRTRSKRLEEKMKDAEGRAKSR